MENKPVEHLFGAGYQASDFNDDALGRGLDELHQAGVTELFAAIAQNAVAEFEIEHEYVHVDTTTLSVTGEYNGEAEKQRKKVNEVVKVTYGHSKAQRPDLKQVVVSLITSQQSALPLWLEVLDGNSSDKNTLQPTVQAYCQQLEAGEEAPWFIMDSASYSRETLGEWGEIRWLTRVPETSKAAKEALRCVRTEEMERLDDNYRIFPLCSIYGGVKQKWLVVYSQAAFERESQALDHRVEKAYACADKALGPLSRQVFACEAEATNALQQLQKSLKWHTLTAQLKCVKHDENAGRPATDAVPTQLEWRIEGTLAANERLIADTRLWQGRFILATNMLDPLPSLSDPSADPLPTPIETQPQLSYAQMLPAYKTQSSSVERGFRFLKDPMVFADNLFLKNPARIMAMIMVMGLALLVYSLAERHLRRQLKLLDETLPHQTGKPTQAITMRRVAQIFEGVDFLVIRSNGLMIKRIILNLTPVRLKIISMFSPQVRHYYFCPT